MSSNKFNNRGKGNRGYNNNFRYKLNIKYVTSTNKSQVRDPTDETSVYKINIWKSRIIRIKFMVKLCTRISIKV